ncbi:uncharacterized protein LOC131680985 [Topomyia yanbarensis]|uniref:uncharacterized protein LOC131680985 n=1 Tax=Topomyia yanbarensis TaxID=2498891 RepID=UPI00273CF03A|nr:uncharacterized protein LOC131680985 [Topomyia yanbarensis]
MVACDSCGQWFHFACVSVDSNVQDEEWSCKKCLEAVIQLPAGASTPNTDTGVIPKPGTRLTESNLEEYVQKQLAVMQVGFERLLKAKDDRHLKELRDQRKKYEQVLKDTERRVLERVERQNLISSSGGGLTASSTVNQPAQMVSSGSTGNQNPKLLGSRSTASSTSYHPQQVAGGSTTGAIGSQPLPWTLGTGPTASSTENPLPQINAQEVSQGNEALAHELMLLEEQQALEKKHMEERSRLLQRHAMFGGGAAGGIGLNPQATAFQPIGSGFFGVSSLSQGQISARQAINKELPIFSGNPEEWPLFLASYENSTRICGYSDEENMLRLQRSLKGKAMETVRCRLLHPANLPGVIATLRTLFGRPEVIVHSLVNKIREMPSPKAEKLCTLIDFGVAVQNVCATITASGLDEYMCNVALLQELTERLPPSIRLNWAYHRQGLNRVTLSEFGDWLGKLVEAASIVTMPTLNISKPERRGRKDDNYINVHSESNSSCEVLSLDRPITASKGCLVCLNECSGLDTCGKFLALGVGSRWTVVKEQRLCRKCLRRHYGACHVKTPCGRNAQQSNESSTTQSCNTHSKRAGKVLFRYVPVTIYGKGKQVTTYAFLDDGSSATLMEHSLLRELDLKGTPYPLCLNWTGGHQREEDESVLLTLKISGVNDTREVFDLPEVYTVRDLSLPKQSVSVSQLATKYSYLKGLPLKSYDDVSPRILIGMNNCRLGHALRSVEGGENEPVVSKTRLGWMIYGPCTMESGTTNSGYSSYHSFHICPCVREEERDLNAALKEYYSIESLGISGSQKSLHSKDEERAIKILSTETRLVGNRYETGLLWRYDQVQLPDNKGMAAKRLACLQKRMRREPELAAAMRSKMLEYEEKGYVRRLSAMEKAEKHSNDWYLPIFPVTNPNKPGKLRIVFDAAAKVNGVSLNSFLLTGPDQLVSLLTVLYKFREFRVAVVGDIREMFFQVQMKKLDQRSQMILWSNGNPEDEPEVYAVAVMTFGAACSPSCAHYVKNRNAERFEEYPRAVECIKYEHYVDDMLMSVETEEEAVKLASEIRSIHSQGGFEIRNWLSNSRSVIDNLHEVSTTEKNMSLCAEMTTEKVLGMWWDTTTDTFTFKLSPKHDEQLLSGIRMPTKREVLRTLMAIYDPMGFICNFLIYLKILMQEIWRSGCGWDDEINGKLAEKWQTWIEALPNVHQVKIPRCYRIITSAKPANNVELHIFCDASENGMAAVAYFRFEEEGKVECAMIGSKTRVAPLKFLSIPRLELQAAVIGARLADCIAKSHRIKIMRRVFWTDSRDVICWLRSDHRRYSQFVAFRVSELLDTTQVDEWRWLPTKMNVADEGTKWQRLPDLRPSSRWFRAQDFLWESEAEWPGHNRDQGSTVEEIRPSVLHHTVTEPLVSFERFSKWKRLLRSMAYARRFITNLHKRIEGATAELGPLTQEELKLAESTIYRIVQQQAYPDEMRLIRSNSSDASPWKRTLPKSSSLYKLSPAIDELGVLRMRGRINACEWVDEATKNPILLPRRNPVTDLVLAEYHASCRHQNHHTALSQVRLKFSIPRLRSEFDRVRRNCQRCKVRQSMPQPPAMGNLPLARMAAFQRPFSYTGIDYFGPMSVTVGRRVEKRWGVLLTCMTTRSVHIEVAHSLTTDSCILALRNFIARRGSPLEIISDRGTNFIGASRELREAMQKIDMTKLMVEFVSPNTKWTFNPPAAPHFGGCWERLIQSIKKIMNDFDVPRLPSDEILRSMLLEIEMILNSRPLTDIPLENDAELPLTPNHFLLGSANGTKPPIIFDNEPAALKRSWTMAQLYADRPIQKGDLVLIVDCNLPRNCWPRGRVVEVVQAKDGQVRRVTVQTATGLLERPATKIAVLDVGANGGKPHGQWRTGGECHITMDCDAPLTTPH